MDNKSRSTKYFNYRPLVSIWLFFMAGIVFASGFYIRSVFAYICSGIAISCLVITFIVKLVLVKDKKRFKLISIVVAFFLSATLFAVNLIINDAKSDFEGEYFISGRVTERSYTTDKYLVITLDKVELSELGTLNKHKLSGKMRIFVRQKAEGNEEYTLGDLVHATLVVKKPTIFSGDGQNFYYLNKNIKLLGFCNYFDIVNTNTQDANLIHKFKTKVISLVTANMSEEYSELAYTMLFGDNKNLSPDIQENYRASGIAHLLAVSGLHVGFIVTLITFVLGLFKLKSKAKFYIVSVIVFIYALVCGFSVSVTRAMLMTMILLYAKMRQKEYDGLSALALAGSLILLFKPMQLYDVGYLLSFGAVSSIILLAPILREFFNKFFYHKLSSALSLAIAVQVGVVPAMAVYFSQLSIFSIVTNIIVIPIASIAFMILFIGVLLGVIFAPLAKLCYIFEFLMKIVTTISSFTGAVSFVNRKRELISAFSLSLVGFGIISSDFVFFKRKVKCTLSISFGLLTLVILVLALIC